MERITERKRKIKNSLTITFVLLSICASPETLQAQSPSPILGFHDCIVEGDGSPRWFSDCDHEFYEAINQLRGGWVLVSGYVWGSFLENYQTNDDTINLSQIPPNINIILRLDSGNRRTLPPIIEEEGYQKYAEAVRDYVLSVPGSERAIIQLGNELDQYLQEYPEWNSTWTPQGVTNEDLGVTTCNHLFGIEKSVQYATPAHYAKLFVTTVRVLREAGLTNPVLNAPLMPRAFAGPETAYPNNICRDYSLGDYLSQIQLEATYQGIENPIGGIAFHTQGIPHDLRFDQDNIVSQTLYDLMIHFQDARIRTESFESDGIRVRAARLPSLDLGGLPIFITEIHPPKPRDSEYFWDWGREEIINWTRGTLAAVRSFNTNNNQNPIEAVILYRWGGGNDPISIKIVPYALNSVIQGSS